MPADKHPSFLTDAWAAGLAGDVQGTSSVQSAARMLAATRGAFAELPLTIGPDSPVWQGGDVADETLQRLITELVTAELAGQRAIATAIDDLLRDHDLRAVLDAGPQSPPQILGRLLNPDGVGAAGIGVSLDSVGPPSAQSTSVTSADGSFLLAVPARLRAANSPLPGLRISGGNTELVFATALADLPRSGLLPPVILGEPLTPLPLDFLGRLADLAPDATPASQGEAPALSLGEDECGLVFRKDSSTDRFPWSVMFRLTDPAVSEPTLVFRLPRPIADNLAGVTDLPAHSLFHPAQRLAGIGAKLTLHLVDRVPITRPISVDAFRDGLSLPHGRVFGSVPIAASISLGYIVRMAQRWTPLGLALGDLVYSLPLAPGEQQRVAVVERTATSRVVDSETLDTSEQVSFTERDDTSAQATFESAFDEAASGGSHIDTHAASSGTAGAAGIGFALGPVVIGGGVASSSGKSSTDGNTNTWMQGSKATTSAAAQTTHSSVQRSASARRHSARTAMRLATASETDRVVTKVISNHNKTRALTVQYWEVLRMFDVSTVVEGVTLTCLVPLDIVKFLPAGEPATLAVPLQSRQEVITRYAELISHADILDRVLPWQYRQGLSLVNDFAGDPRATVAAPDGDAADIVQLRLVGRFLPFEDLYVSVISTRGFRSGPVLLTGSVAELPTGKDAYSSPEQLVGALRARRGPGAGAAMSTLVGSATLPASIPRQEVSRFEISRRFRRLDYTFLPEAVQNLSIAKNLFGIAGDLSAAVAAAAATGSQRASYTADALEGLLGGPPIAGFNATLQGTTFADQSYAAAPLELPGSGFPIAARMIPPQLSQASLLHIEKTLQWCIRNTMTSSIAVYSSLTSEERAVMLERYEIALPADDTGTSASVPLLSCVTNTVLGYFGNCMILPFMIPAAATQASTVRDDQGNVITAGLTTGDITDALARFHTEGFDPPRSRIALPTKGVLGEAVLGHCPSAEKIDLTRFWNWQDSPGDEATAISPVALPQGLLTEGLTAPDKLVGLAPIFNNFSTAGVPAGTSLADSLIQAAAKESGFDIKSLTNADNLATLTGKTLDTAEAARKDALAQATSLATKAMESAVELQTGKKKEAKKDDKKDGKDPAEPKPTPPPEQPQPPKPPAALSVFFQKDKTDIVDAPPSGAATGQVAVIAEWVAKAKAAKASAITIRGFASPEGTEAHNTGLVADRAAALKSRLEAEGLTGVTVSPGGILAGQTGEFPKLRRADATVTAHG